MLKLEPISKRRIWGTKKLHEYCGDQSIDKIGSIYTVSAIEEISNRITNGEYAGQDLYHLVKQNPEMLGLEKGETYPLIVSMTGAGDNLSIQVHPTDDYVMENGIEKTGKSESWYFLEGPDEGWIYAGAKIEDKTIIREKIQEGKYKEVVDTLPVNQLDYVFIPSGTLHALTTGSLVYEIQQSTDITYRFYDYDRVDKDEKKRELHLENALDTLEPSKKPEKSALQKNEWKKEKPYQILLTDFKEGYENKETVAQAMTVINGTLRIENETVEKGMSILILPGEKLDVRQSAEVIIATPNMYWRS
ncbi:class I mannose-6-phosphate isomerase [Cytobacillus sp. Hz8]|uniref:class I mannose-6-phosphate isomerase n=1 Tax=Cytobacillus sp. Hz8 TaxID=3347168 RepID=UPI0035DF5F82